MGSSSSSDDNVRSISAAAGRLLLVEPRPLGPAGEVSEPMDAGVPIAVAVAVAIDVLGVSSCRPLITDISEISKSSSSPSSANNEAPLDWPRDVSPPLVLVDHRPLGSIVTTSKLLGVFWRMSLTYLPHVISQHPSAKGDELTHPQRVARMAPVCYK